MKSSTNKFCLGVHEISGDVTFPHEWIVFAPFERGDPVPDEADLRAVPAALCLGKKTVEGLRAKQINNQYNFTAQLGEPPNGRDKVAYAYLRIESPGPQTVTIGMSADYQFQAWLNGKDIVDTTTEGNDLLFPPAISDNLYDVNFLKGENLLVVRLISGTSSSLLAVGGPHELRRGNFNSLLVDPFLNGDPRWTADSRRCVADDKEPVRVGNRRELFVDEFMISGMSGGAIRYLHHPVPREIVHRLDMPWEGKTSAYLSVFEDGDKVIMTYNATPTDMSRQTTGVLESNDGIHFKRPMLNLVDHNGSTANNLLLSRGESGHNFSMFRDPNPDAPESERYKAISYFPGGSGLSAWVSPNRIDWEMVREDRIIERYNPVTGEEQGAFDSQNIAFWDPERKIYVCYYRGPTPAPGGVGGYVRERGIWRAVSSDFREWTNLKPIKYSDCRLEDMYVNSIKPYFRAPHIYIGTPNRIVPRRTKYPDWKRVGDWATNGINDAILMSSRDGITFERWEDGFVRPIAEPEVWTDRNNYVAWGMIPTNPDEISLYWTEHYRHDGMRIRRGTLRTDGFVSLHSGATQVGEVLTRAMIFSGDQLEINYATSAIGTIRIELCDGDGIPYPGFSFTDSEILFGNEIAAVFHWNSATDVSSLAGKPVRLRVRLNDADLYSFQFKQQQKE